MLGGGDSYQLSERQARTRRNEETRKAMSTAAPRVDDSLLAQFANLATPTLANALDDVAFAGVLAGLSQVVPGTRCAGRAITVLQVRHERRRWFFDAEKE